MAYQHTPRVEKRASVRPGQVLAALLVVALVGASLWWLSRDRLTTTTRGGDATPPAPQASLPRLGYVSIGRPDDPSPEGSAYLSSFLQGLADLGYRDGQNVLIEYRFAEGDAARLPSMVNELLALPVAVIVAADSQAVRVTLNATKDVPLIVTTSTDPVGTGRAASLAEPGGNITGLTISVPGLMGKRLELLHQLAPTVRQVGVLWEANNVSRVDWSEAEEAAQGLELELVSLQVQEGADIASVLSSARAAGIDGVLVFATPLLNMRRIEITTRALELSLPVVGTVESWAEAGAVASYAPSLDALFYRSASYVVSILRGAEPGKLPFERPRSFDLVLNAKSAQTLGLEINNDLASAAKRVIR